MLHSGELFSADRPLKSPGTSYILAFSKPSYLERFTWVQQQKTVNFFISNHIQVQQQQVEQKSVFRYYENRKQPGSDPLGVLIIDLYDCQGKEFFKPAGLKRMD